mgnify:CR=1 FL=1
MSSANVDAMVREAKRAIRAGNKSEAQTLLLKATELDQSNEQAWMWLSAVVETVEDQMICLENVLQINPSNADAKRGLDLLRKKAPPPPPAEKPPSKPNNPFLIEGAEWEIDGNTDFLLDALSPSSPKTSKTPTPPPSSSPRDLLSDDDDPINPPTDPFVSVFESADIFETPYDDDDESESKSGSLDRLNTIDDQKSSSRISSPPKSNPTNDFDDISSLDDDIFGEDTLKDEVDEFLAGDSFFDEPAQKSSAPPPKQKSAPKPEPDMMSVGADEDPSVYFEMIPVEIKATRIPGIDETYPSMLIPSIIGLVLLNIGALAMLFLN